MIFFKKKKKRVHHTKIDKSIFDKVAHLKTLPEYSKRLNVIYPLIGDFVKIRIKWKGNSLLYETIEPNLTKKEQDVLKELSRGLLETVDVDLSKVKGERSIDYILDSVLELLMEIEAHVSEKELKNIVYYLLRNSVGLNEIEPLLHDPYIEDISCDGAGIPIFIRHRKYGSMQTNIIFKEKNILDSFILKLAQMTGKYVSYAQPILDGVLPNGARVNATFGTEVTRKGSTFTLRKFREMPFTPIDLIKLGTVSPEVLAYLWMMIENKKSIIISGGSATGKTTLLNALSLFIKPENKIVSIEDTAELNLPHKNWIPSITKEGIGLEKRGEIGMDDLLKESFREAPDYIIVGEVRGKEAYVMFQGMASGHASLGTIHAHSFSSVVQRLETPPLNLNPELVSNIDALIVLTHARKLGKNSRRVKEIIEIKGVDQSTRQIQTVNSFVWDPFKDRLEFKNSHLLNALSKELGIPKEEIEKEYKNRIKLLKWMEDRKVNDFKKFAEIISHYYKSPREVLKKIRRY